ncbi:MAG: polysaccharide deacetylase family protein [Bacteroidetes bacterium 43-93]|jgi:peptidoglycan/xylan/chitin deacetylase (PgdA/CDA1 family)|nr:polysaccharide deacetylase family protein [Bacteroidota bacterium]OJX01150.1 MAG: polysaccharide deacetylase family protein [Bacteroidetes bacterium 43-93]
MAYIVKTPWWLRKLYGNFIWKMPPGDELAVYLTFDDGPHPTATPFVLDQLKKYHATATFFCIGKNVVQHPDIYKRTLNEGHTTGNHTYNHVNGWHTKTAGYYKNVRKAAAHIKSNLFRPPYGRIKRSQANILFRSNPDLHIYMWDVLSGDFDTELTAEACLDNVLNNLEPGSIVVFHDSDKAWPRMSYALPKVLEYCAGKNWAVRALPQ